MEAGNYCNDYICDNGYEATIPLTLKCNETGQWEWNKNLTEKLCTGKNPAGTQRWTNVVSSLIQRLRFRIGVEMTLIQRCVPAGLIKSVALLSSVEHPFFYLEYSQTWLKDHMY